MIMGIGLSYLSDVYDPRRVEAVFPWIVNKPVMK